MAEAATSAVDASAALTAAGAIYEGHVMHMRLRPRAHRFRYRMFTFLLDLDRLGEAQTRLFRVNRRGVFSHRDADHGPRDGSPLRPWVEATLAEAGRPAAARIRLLAMPRMLGFVFNPLSVYFCEDADGRLHSLIYEVKNTFGDQIAYVADASAGAGAGAGAGAEGAMRRHRQGKAMFVSPFIGMDQTYRFDVAPPDARLAIRIKQGDAEGDLLIATQTGDRRPLGDRALARLLLGQPLMTWKVLLGIHWEALRLALKRAPFRRYPGAEGAFGPVHRAEGGPAPAPGARGAAPGAGAGAAPQSLESAAGAV